MFPRWTNPDQAPQLPQVGDDHRPVCLRHWRETQLCDGRRQPVRQINGTIIQRHRPPRGIVDQCLTLSPRVRSAGIRQQTFEPPFKTVLRPAPAKGQQRPNDYNTRHGKADSEENKGRIVTPGATGVSTLTVIHDRDCDPRIEGINPLAGNSDPSQQARLPGGRGVGKDRRGLKQAAGKTVCHPDHHRRVKALPVATIETRLNPGVGIGIAKGPEATKFIPDATGITHHDVRLDPRCTKRRRHRGREIGAIAATHLEEEAVERILRRQIKGGVIGKPVGEPLQQQSGKVTVACQSGAGLTRPGRQPRIGIRQGRRFCRNDQRRR